MRHFKAYVGNNVFIGLLTVNTLLIAYKNVHAFLTQTTMKEIVHAGPKINKLRTYETGHGFTLIKYEYVVYILY